MPGNTHNQRPEIARYFGESVLVKIPVCKQKSGDRMNPLSRYTSFNMIMRVTKAE